MLDLIKVEEVDNKVIIPKEDFEKIIADVDSLASALPFVFFITAPTSELSDLPALKSATSCALLNRWES